MNRIPDYGDGHLDGCLVMGEMFLSLKSSEGSIVKGQIKDVESKDSLANANIKIYFLNSVEPLQLSSDSNGNFEFYKKSKINQINVEYVGYRNLAINFEGRKLFQ